MFPDSKSNYDLESGCDAKHIRKTPSRRTTRSFLCLIVSLFRLTKMVVELVLRKKPRQSIIHEIHNTDWNMVFTASYNVIPSNVLYCTETIQTT